MTSASARVAISSHWLRNSTAPTTCRICWSASPNRHRICTPPSMYHFFWSAIRFRTDVPTSASFGVIPPVLLSYLQERGISTELAKRECKELHFENKGRPYFAIGFRIWQVVMRCATAISKVVSLQRTSPISDKVENSRQPVIFSRASWITSFLSIRVRNNPQCPRLTTQDYIILNSVSNLAKAEGILADYSQIGCFLDNDTAGRTACEHLQRFGERLPTSPYTIVSIRT